MANEIRITGSLSVANGFLDQDIRPSQTSITQNSVGAGGGVFAATTTAAAISTGTATTCGYAFFRNVSASGDAYLGTLTGASFVQFATLKPGEYAIIRLGTNSPTAKSSTGTVNIQYLILAD